MTGQGGFAFAHRQLIVLDKQLEKGYNYSMMYEGMTQGVFPMPASKLSVVPKKARSPFRRRSVGSGD
jgi:hypothetical protein